jgi:hypothetical protein
MNHPEVIPKDRSKLYNWQVPTNFWQDFIAMQIRRNCPRLNQDLLDKFREKDGFERVLARGKVDVTSNFSFTACPCKSGKAVCGLFNCSLPNGEQEYICTGPIQKEKKVSLFAIMDLKGYEEKWSKNANPPHSDCPYNLGNKTGLSRTEACDFILDTLEDHSDYETGRW